MGQNKETSTPKEKWVSWKYIKKIILINEDTDYETTESNISKSIEFKGVNIWILFCATILASIGLNVNSTAVIIGAMLISPLMGPINGIGFAVGTFNDDLLRKSLRNLAIMVIISLLASTLYFIVSPLSDAQSELLARTRPTIFDVLIAFFGGCAGFIATSRKDQPFTIISGVAIATALMPPLCTAGFGIATLQFKYFFGAFYLFFINSVFIACATFLLTKYLKFPASTFVYPGRERIVKRTIIIFSILVMIPSLFFAINVVKESSFNNQVIKYITEIQKNDILKDTQLINYKKEYNRNKSSLNLFLVGKQLSATEIDTLRKIMVTDFGLSKTQLTIKQTSQVVDVNMQTSVLEEIIANKSSELQEKEHQIAQLNNQIDTLKMHQDKYQEQTAIIGNKYKYAISSISISEINYYQPKNNTTTKIPTLYIKWDNGKRDESIITELKTWVPLLLNVPSVKIVEQ